MDLRLARFLREKLHLTGTKISCGVGGCGACVVNAEVQDSTGKKNNISVNSVRFKLWKIMHIFIGKRNLWRSMQDKLSAQAYVSNEHSIRIQLDMCF